MPSGSKKRKAAKKKKEKEANNNNSSSIDTSNIQGNEDPKSHDERESDGGEVEYPASQDHHSQQHQFDEGNEEPEKTDSSAAADQKSVEVLIADADESQKVNPEEDSIVKVETELNSEQHDQIKDIGTEHIESAKESDEGEDRSSNSSSDNESLSIEKKEVKPQDNGEKKVEDIIQITENEESIEGISNTSVVEAERGVGFNTPTAPIPVSESVQRAVEVEGIQVENPEAGDMIEYESMKTLLNTNNATEENTSLPNSNVYPQETILTISTGVSPTSDAIVKMVKNTNKSSAQLPKNVASFVNGDKEKILTSSKEHRAEAPKQLKKSDIRDTDIKSSTLTSSDDHTAETSKYAEKPKEFETTAVSEKQPPVASAPQVAERTSWMSCCGLFDLFTGSSK